MDGETDGWAHDDLMSDYVVSDARMESIGFLEYIYDFRAPSRKEKKSRLDDVPCWRRERRRTRSSREPPSGAHPRRRGGPRFVDETRRKRSSCDALRIVLY